MKILGIIPARGGSKGLKRKNILPLGKKPLLQYTCESARNSKLLTKVILSSDDEEIISTLSQEYDTYIEPGEAEEELETPEGIESVVMETADTPEPSFEASIVEVSELEEDAEEEKVEVEETEEENED